MCDLPRESCDSIQVNMNFDGVNEQNEFQRCLRLLYESAYCGARSEERVISYAWGRSCVGCTFSDGELMSIDKNVLARHS